MHNRPGRDCPEDLIKKYGPRSSGLGAGEDFRDNIRLSYEILQRLVEAYAGFETPADSFWKSLRF